MKRLLFLFAFLTFIVACSEPEPPSLPPEEILRQTAVQLSSRSTFHFMIERDGAPAFVDPDQALSFRRAEGDYLAPDRASAVVRVIAPALVTDVDVVSIGKVQWQTNPLTGQWEELPPNWGFNPAVLFDAETGLQTVLVDGLTAVTLLGSEKIKGASTNKPLYALIGTADGTQLEKMSGGLIEPGVVQIQLWIDPETFDLQRALVTETETSAGESRTWKIDFSQFDQALTIEPPV